MADGFGPPASRQNHEQFLPRNPFIPSDLRMVNPSYPPPIVDTRMGRFHGGTRATPSFRPPFTAEMQHHPVQPRNPYTYNQDSNRQLHFTTNQESMQQRMNTFPNTTVFRPSGSLFLPSYGGVGSLTPVAPVAGLSRSCPTQFAGSPTTFVHGGHPREYSFVSPGSHVTSCHVTGSGVVGNVRTGSANFPQPPGAATVALSDKTWVERFVQERHIVKSGEDQMNRLKICEAKELLRKWLCLTADLVNERDKLIECIALDKPQWDKLLHEAEKVKLNQALKNRAQKYQEVGKDQQEWEILLGNEKIVKIEAIFANRGVVEKLEQQISQRTKKRVTQRNKRKERISERKEADERRSLLHKKIDGWREKAIAKEEASRKAALLKSEAGGVLGEVRRKYSETTKGLELLKSLKKLRDIRKQEAERKGVYRQPTDGENKYFTERLEYMEKLMTRRKALYEVEQKALEVMLTEEEEEKYRKKREERRIQQDLFKARDPMEDFFSYYNQADRSLQSLLQIRHQWDMFLVHENVPGASRVPDGWVSPVGPSSELWASMLEQHETGT